MSLTLSSLVMIDSLITIIQAIGRDFSTIRNCRQVCHQWKKIVEIHGNYQPFSSSEELFHLLKRIKKNSVQVLDIRISDNLNLSLVIDNLMEMKSWTLPAESSPSQFYFAIIKIILDYFFQSSLSHFFLTGGDDHLERNQLINLLGTYSWTSPLLLFLSDNRDQLNWSSDLSLGNIRLLVKNENIRYPLREKIFDFQEHEDSSVQYYQLSKMF